MFSVAWVKIETRQEVWGCFPRPILIIILLLWHIKTAASSGTHQISETRSLDVRTVYFNFFSGYCWLFLTPLKYYEGFRLIQFHVSLSYRQHNVKISDSYNHSLFLRAIGNCLKTAGSLIHGRRNWTFINQLSSIKEIICKI